MEHQELMARNLRAGIEQIKSYQRSLNWASPMFHHWLGVMERENGYEVEVLIEEKTAIQMRERRNDWHAAALLAKLRIQKQRGF